MSGTVVPEAVVSGTFVSETILSGTVVPGWVGLLGYWLLPKLDGTVTVIWTTIP